MVRRRGDLIISETKHGFVCANVGVDLSNVDEGWAALLPDDSDRSARRSATGSAPRSASRWPSSCRTRSADPGRRGLTDVAIGCAGIQAVVDLRGTEDSRGRGSQVTEVCVVDGLAAAAEVVMRQGDRGGGRRRARRRGGVARTRRGARGGRPAPAGGPLPLAAQPRNQPRTSVTPVVRSVQPAPSRGAAGPARIEGRCGRASPEARPGALHRRRRPTPAAPAMAARSSFTDVSIPVPMLQSSPLPDRGVHEGVHGVVDVGAKSPV